MKKFLRSFNHWFIFGLILSLLPLLFSTWRLCGNSSPPLSWIDATKLVTLRGELLLVCVALLGGVIGELVKEDSDWKIFRYWLIGASLVLALFSTYAFAESILGNVRQDYIFSTSISVLVSTIVLNTLARLLPQKRISIFGGMENE